jgi:hypothetical protein
VKKGGIHGSSCIGSAQTHTTSAFLDTILTMHIAPTVSSLHHIISPHPEPIPSSHPSNARSLKHCPLLHPCPGLSTHLPTNFHHPELSMHWKIACLQLLVHSQPQGRLHDSQPLPFVSRQYWRTSWSKG